MHCALSQADNTSSRTRARNCFPVVALGKLKLHYGPLEESGERVMEKEEERGSKRKGERKSETRASVLFFSALATTKLLQGSRRKVIQPAISPLCPSFVSRLVDGRTRILLAIASYFSQSYALFPSAVTLVTSSMWWLPTLLINIVVSSARGCSLLQFACMSFLPLLIGETPNWSWTVSGVTL